jgi:hypothetical protein
MRERGRPQDPKIMSEARLDASAVVEDEWRQTGPPLQSFLITASMKTDEGPELNPKQRARCFGWKPGHG